MAFRRLKATGIVVFAGAGWACTDLDPVGPAPSATTASSPIVANSSVSWLEGCGWIEVSLHDRARATVTLSSNEDCGPLQLFLDSAASFDRHASRLRLSVLVQVEGDEQALSPVLMAAWTDSMEVLDPPGLHRNPRSDLVGFLNPDSLESEVGSAWHGASIWQLEASPGSEAATQVFGPREMEIQLHHGVRHIRFPVRLRAERAAALVPDEVPDSVPPDLYDHIDVDYGVPQNFLLIMFDPAATPEQKSAAIQVTGGEVAGGFPFTGDGPLHGYYLVRIPTDGTIGPTLRALDKVYEMPAVVSAGLDIPLAPASRRPRDGSGWVDWQVHPDSADGINWAQEFVAGPLAWGCAIGNVDVRIAVIDHGFTLSNDLAANMTYASDLVAGRHGTQVASVLAARGSNGEQMTGMMWRAGLRFYDYAPQGRARLQHALNALQAAAAHNVHIANISFDVDWENLGGIPNPPSAVNHEIGELAYRQIHGVLQKLQSSPQTDLPLLVIAAGNLGLDAFWSVLPRAVEDFPDHVLVVGGVGRQPTSAGGTVPLWAHSNSGSLVEIAAPAEQVGAIWEDGVVRPDDGTSLAAPLVAGAAGLLLSFDPRIPTDSLKHVILAGAESGGRIAVADGHSYPVLNAYEALKHAARRDGAPLCGSRLVANGTDLMVERTSGWQPLLTLGGDWGMLNSIHGGRVLDAYVRDLNSGVQSNDRFELVNGAWVRTGAAPSVGFYGAREGSIYNSMIGASHSGDSTAIIYKVDGWLSPNFQVRIFKSTNYGTVYHLHFTQEPFTATMNDACIMWDAGGGCDPITLYNGDLIRPGASWLPGGGKLLVWFARGTQLQVISGAYACGNDGSYMCANVEREEEWLRTDFYEMDVTSGDRRPLFSIPYEVQSAAVSEDGGEIVITRNLHREEGFTGWHTEPNPWGEEIWETTSSLLIELFDCSVEWRYYESGEILATAPFDKTCRTIEFHAEGGASISTDWFLGSMSP